MDAHRLLDIFVTEGDELLAELERGLVALEAGDGEQDTIHSVFRAAHTLKGNAGMVGLEAIVSVTHGLEGVLERVRSNALAVSPALTSALLAGLDVIRAQVALVANGTTPLLDATATEVIASLQPWLGKSEAQPTRNAAPESPPEELRVFDVRLRFRPDVFYSGTDPTALVREVSELGELLFCTPDLTQLPAFGEFDPQCFFIAWHLALRTQVNRATLEQVFLFVSDEHQVDITDVTAHHQQELAQRQADKKVGELLVEEGAVKETDLRALLQRQRKLGELLVEDGRVSRETLDRVLAKQKVARRTANSASIRVDVDKLDRLVNAVGELVITVSQVGQQSRHAAASPQTLVSAVEALEAISRELQDQALSLRMVPVEETFSRFHRAVRDLASQLGKYVVLETRGTETELDKNVIEQLVDPLKHMIRNSVSHGIEAPAERVASGKGDTGRLILSASQREGHIVIEVSDDGRGIDPESVLQRARERGLVQEGQLLTEPEICDLLFLPGFSTAAEVSEISGRGVGLDVVRRNVEDLRGTVEIESRFGRGTTFRIRLPLTLAIIDGMLVRVGHETVAIPLLSVLELVEPAPATLTTIEGRGQAVVVRGELLPMVRLSEVLSFAELSEPSRESKVVVIENQGRKFGLLVDRVLGMEQTVIKSLDKSFTLLQRMEQRCARPEGIAGATILGDGSVGFILDVDGIEQAAFGTKPTSSWMS